MKVKDILSGWKNYLIDDPVSEELAKQRAAICAKCPQAKEGKFTAVLKDYKIKEIEGRYCDKCKCPLSAKTRSKNEKCPLNKWPPEKS